jgi:hypothetical protein
MALSDVSVGCTLFEKNLDEARPRGARTPTVSPETRNFTLLHGLIVQESDISLLGLLSPDADTTHDDLELRKYEVVAEAVPHFSTRGLGQNPRAGELHHDRKLSILRSSFNSLVYPRLISYPEY